MIKECSKVNCIVIKVSLFKELIFNMTSFFRLATYFVQEIRLAANLYFIVDKNKLLSLIICFLNFACTIYNIVMLPFLMLLSNHIRHEHGSRQLALCLPFVNPVTSILWIWVDVWNTKKLIQTWLNNYSCVKIV